MFFIFFLNGAMCSIFLLDENSYFILKDGNFDTIWSQIDHIFHLIRLGSESTERSYDPTEHNMAEDKDFIYVFNYDSPSVRKNCV